MFWEKKRLAAVLLVALIALTSVFADSDITGRIMGKVLTDDGEMLVAGITIIDEDGNSWRETTNDYGGYVLKLNPGHYTLIFDKGYEFTTYTVEYDVESYKTYYLKDVRLKQLFDSYALGWIGGDPHQHSVYSDGLDNLDQLVTANVSMGLYWGFLTDHDSSRGVPEWREATGSVTVLTQADGVRRRFNGFAGDEVSSTFGHYQSIGTGMVFEKYDVNLTESEISSPDNKSFAREKAIFIAESIKNSDGTTQMNHPYSSGNMGIMNYMAEDDWDFFSYFDTIEVWNGYFICPDGRYTSKTSENQNYSSKILWYSILNNMKNGGRFMAATGGTDDHDSSGEAPAKYRVDFDHDPENITQYYNLCRYERKYAGTPTTYVNLKGGEITSENVQTALENGNSFISNGPIVICKIGSAIYGDTVKATDGCATISCNIFDRDGMNTIRIVKNGEVVQEVYVSMADTYTDDIFVSGLESGDWFLIEVLGDFNNYAITNPFFVE